MVPLPEPMYLPPLDKCHTGEQLLVSWKLVSDAVEGAQSSNESRPHLRAFLQDPEIRQLLAHPFTAFSGPTSQTKAIFETKTSAINVTPSSTGRFDIKEVKEDALWLSGQAKIDEITSLRVVLAENQSRSTAKLLGPFSHEEITSIKDATGNSKLLNFISAGPSPEGVEVEKLENDFKDQNNRRKRILKTYLSERQLLWKTTKILLQASWISSGSIPSHEKAPSAAAPLLVEIGSDILAQIEDADKWLVRCIKAVARNVENISNGSGWFADVGGDDEVEAAWVSSQLIEILHILEIIYQLVDSLPTFSSSLLVLEWFRTMAGLSFFDRFNAPDESFQSLISPLRAAVCLVSLNLLKVESSQLALHEVEGLGELSPASDRPYLCNSQTIIEIHGIVMNAAEELYGTSCLTVFGWCAILHALQARTTRQLALEASDGAADFSGSGGNSEPDLYADVMESIMDSSDEDPIDFLGRMAYEVMKCTSVISELASSLGKGPGAFFAPFVGARMRLTLLELVIFACSVPAISYNEDVLEATLAILTSGQDSPDMDDAYQVVPQNDPLAIFLASDESRTMLLESAARRYPYEDLPFLKLVRATSACETLYAQKGVPSLIDILEELPTFTFVLPEGFIDYETTAEEENNNFIRLTTDIDLFEARGRLKSLPSSYPSGSKSLILARTATDFCIPAGTIGRIVSDSGPKTAMWFHQFSGLRYFGKLLETCLTASDQIDAIKGEVDEEAAAELIGLFAGLLKACSNASTFHPDAADQAHRVLETASSGLTRNGDIISVVFGIFEEELQRKASLVGSEVSLDVLVSCVRFIQAVMPICPGRVWPFIVRSGMLENNGSSGWLSRIVGSIESVNGQYPLLLSSAQLYGALIEDLVTHAVARRCGNRSPARPGNREDLGTGVPEKVLSKVLLSYTQYMVDVLESSCIWKFGLENDRFSLVKSISISLSSILRYSNSLLQQAETIPSALRSLEPAASHIKNTFLGRTSGVLRFQPLLRAYMDGLEMHQISIHIQAKRSIVEQVNAVLLFTKDLLEADVTQEESPPQLEVLLFKASPIIARLYSVDESFRPSVVALFQALIVRASAGVREPPSLLGHLGSQTSKNFLQILSDLDRPLASEGNVLYIWRFLSTVVTSRQQWFANYLLTGKTPRDAMKRQTSQEAVDINDKPLLLYALGRLSKIDQLQKTEALAMLQFVSLAQNHWPWTLYDLQKHASFIQGISEYVGTLPPVQPSSRLDDRIESCYKIQMAAYIAQILAMHLFHSRQMGDVTSAKKLVPNLSYFARFAVAMPDYNASLHGNLKRNFESRYPGCSLDEFKRRNVESYRFGRDYLYDLPRANKMLSFDEAWTGRKNDGYGNELATANVNLSLVDAQIAVLNSWKLLAIELSSNLKDQIELQKIMAKVVKDSLNSNIRSQFSEEIFVKLNQTRADFAHVLLQRLLEVKSTVPELYAENGRFSQGVLSTVWDAVRGIGRSLGLTLSAGDPTYHQSLLRLLYLALRLHAEAKIEEQDLRRSTRIGQQQSNEVVPLVLEVLETIVANGFRDLAAALHDQPENVSPEDFALVTGVLQICLQIPSVELCYSQIVSMIAACNTWRVAANLFSWSDKFAIKGDPIYGELSILFLLELSSIPAMAEYLATEGILGLISDASITTYLRRPNISPFADGAGPQRCYNIWTRGILPLLLNILDAVGISVASEVAIFLSQFPLLLKQSSAAFDAPESTRIGTKSQTKYVTLSVVSEVHSLSLIFYIINGFRTESIANIEIPEVEWDSTSVLENVEYWLSSRVLLRERILPMGKRELDLAKCKVDSDTSCGSSRLEEMIVGELAGIKEILSGE